ncbi:MAG: hypothetical protein HY710_15250 [Candidatus Latescibacteria bacterium]|nr:hypothetical protein [Candidatus Latescibacterota bacterium]
MITLVILLLIGAAIGAVLVIPPERHPPIVREVVRQVEHVMIGVLTMIRS